LITSHSGTFDERREAIGALPGSNGSQAEFSETERVPLAAPVSVRDAVR